MARKSISPARKERRRKWHEEHAAERSPREQGISDAKQRKGSDGDKKARKGRPQKPGRFRGRT